MHLYNQLQIYSYIDKRLFLQLQIEIAPKPVIPFLKVEGWFLNTLINTFDGVFLMDDLMNVLNSNITKANRAIDQIWALLYTIDSFEKNCDRTEELYKNIRDSSPLDELLDKVNDFKTEILKYIEKSAEKDNGAKSNTNPKN